MKQQHVLHDENVLISHQFRDVNQLVEPGGLLPKEILKFRFSDFGRKVNFSSFLRKILLKLALKFFIESSNKKQIKVSGLPKISYLGEGSHSTIPQNFCLCCNWKRHLPQLAPYLQQHTGHLLLLLLEGQGEVK